MTDSRRFQEAIVSARRRLSLSQLATDLAIALGVGLVIAAMMLLGSATLPWMAGVAGLAVLAGGMASALRAPTFVGAAAEIDERARCQNLVRTAAELSVDASNARPHVVDVVLREAASAIDRISIASLVPLAPALTRLAIVLAVWAVLLGLTGTTRVDVVRRLVSPATATAELSDIAVVVTPPSYTGRATERLTDPSRIDALAGSRIEVRIGRGGPVSVQTLSGSLAPLDSTRTAFAFTAQTDGFLAIASTYSGSTQRRLIGLTVTPDHPPRVRITAPAKDMFIADVHKSIPVTIEADDDMGLASLRLRYTKVSGSGERFTFVDGEMPVTLSRADTRHWKAAGTLALDPIRLEPGDMVVYRGVATDDRPGATPTESDAFIVEITTPGMLAAEGFSLDDEQDKYALSQQMVILKTERLLAKASSMAPESLAYQSQMIAAEQRSVRAQFVFMMGGEVAEEVIAAAGVQDLNEEAEAANESDLAAGRMVNRGRVALVDAIRMMSRASADLNEVNPTSALPQEKKALASLQLAFSRTRYLLRALTQRERLDLSRRLTGVMTLAARDTKPVPTSEEDPRLAALRSVMADLSTLSARPDAAGLSASARRLLEIDPSDERLKRVAAGLDAAENDIRRSRVEIARRRIEDAVLALAPAMRAQLSPAAAAVSSPAARRLQGAISPEIRR